MKKSLIFLFVIVLGGTGAYFGLLRDPGVPVVNEAVVEPIGSGVSGEATELTGNIEIQRVVSPLGIEAWLVEEHSIPIVAMNLGFQGGAYLDKDSKEGTARLLTTLLDEGAGDLDSEAFQSTLDENSISLSFSASRDSITGGLRSLSANKELAFNLLRMALNQPRFDEEPVERMRAQMAVLQKRRAASPNAIASDNLFGALFPDHKYARPVIGDPTSMALISVSDLDVYRKSYLTQDRLKVAVVGDITPDELARVLDEVFGSLPAAGTPREVDPIAVDASGKTIVVPFNNPQSSVIFGGQGLMQDDEEFIPVFVTNYIIGSGGFNSRLMQEVREKRGLTYSIYTQFSPLDRAGLFMGAVASDNAKVAEAVAITKAEIDRLRTEGVSEQELSDAKTYLTGAFALRFDSNAKIASQLINYQLGDFPFDYINIRNGLVDDVSMDDVNAILERFPPSEELTFVVVGQPEGIASSD